MRKSIVSLVILLPMLLMGQGSRPPVTTLNGLSDVVITSPTLGQVLTYDTGSSHWINSAAPAGSLSTLSDVSLASILPGQLLQYNFISAKWVNYGPLAFTDITGNINVSQMASGGGADATTYWRGDGTWAKPTTGAVAFTNNLLVGDGAGNAIDALASNLQLIANQFLYTSSGNYGLVFRVENDDTTAGHTSVASNLAVTTAGNQLLLSSLGTTSNPLGIVAAGDQMIGASNNLVLWSTGDSFKWSNDTGTTERMRMGSGLTVGTTTDPGAGFINAKNGYKQNDTAISSAIYNVEPSPTPAPIGNADTYIPASRITITAGDVSVGTTYHAIIHVVKTASGTASGPLIVRMGTTGTLSDAAVYTASAFAAGTAIVDAGIIEIWTRFNAVGASAVATHIITLNHNGATTGLWNYGTQAVTGTAATPASFNSTAVTKIGLSYTAGLSGSHTVTVLKAELIKP